jgi:chromosome condensin MukBEF ATPase and DNA-binding subunit MukB
MSSLSRREAGTQGALASASSRAEAAEKRVSQLEKEADGLAREVGMLQVGARVCVCVCVHVCVCVLDRLWVFGGVERHTYKREVVFVKSGVMFRP